MAKDQNGAELEFDPALEPFMKALLSDKGIQCKQASEVGKRKVMYFRGKDLVKFALANQELLMNKCKGTLEAVLGGNAPSTEEDAQKLGNALIYNKFCYRAEFAPVSEKAAADKKLRKWPDRLHRTYRQIFESDSFYIISYQSNDGLQHMYLVLLIAAVLLAVMFPAWPRWAKIGLWYFLVILPSLWILLILGRVVIFFLFYVIGFDFWILPNFLTAETFSGTFKPLWSLYRLRPEDKLPMVWRIIIFVIVQWLYQQTKETSVAATVVSSYNDVLKWGVDKLTQEAIVKKPSLPRMDEFKDTYDREI